MLKNNIQRAAALLLLSTTLFTACKKENTDPENTFSGNGTFILCEGAFLQGNSRIDFYKSENGELVTNIFETANGIPLGDVLQSMIVYNNTAYIVVNNSGKIETVNPTDFKSKGTLSGFTSPRYVCVTEPGKAYVSDLFSGAVSIVNLNSMSITGTISLPGWTEEMLKTENGVWVTNGMREYTYILENDAVADSVLVGYGSTSIRKDANGKIWILTGGNYMDNTPSKLVRVNESTRNVEWEYVLPDYGASKLRMNAQQNMLYFLYSGKVYRKSMDDVSNPEQFISLPGKYFYGIGIHPENGQVWLGDAGDFSSAGSVYIFSSGGGLLKNFTTGVAPTDFVF
ncbi:MAG: DUF5074 domain-containing protein [Flavobacteriales bacterium]|nr:DUF5074 domain-containing protein [Flavobacteriales bacterium]